MNVTSNIKEFYAGDNLDWVVSSSDLSSLSGHALRVVLSNAAFPKIEFIATNQIDGTWTVSKTATETSELESSKYKVFYIFTKSSEGLAKQVDGGFVEIKPNILLTANYDSRTDNQKQLEAVRELIAGRIIEGVNQFSVEGRSVTLMTITELLQLEANLIKKVNSELSISELKEKGKTNRNKLKIRCNNIINL